MLKAELRKKYKALRQELNEVVVDEKSLTIANNAIRLPIWEGTYYHTFLTIASKQEVNTEFLLNILAGKDKEILISKSNFEDNSMKHFLLTDSTRIRVNKWGIPEPEDGIEVPPEKIQVVFVPLLAFDLTGNRVGYGKGFYDKFLADCDPSCIKVGLSFFAPEARIQDTHPNDIRLDYCITPEKTYQF